MEARKLGRGLEEISNQFLSKPKPQNTIEELTKRLDNLEKRFVQNQLSVVADNTAVQSTPVQSAPAESVQIGQYQNILKQFKYNLGHAYLTSGIISYNGMYLIFDSWEEKIQEQEISAYLAEHVKNTDEILNNLKLGKFYSIMITTKESNIFLQSIPGNKNYFLSLLVKSGGNIGLADLCLKNVSKELSLI